MDYYSPYIPLHEQTISAVACIESSPCENIKSAIQEVARKISQISVDSWNDSSKTKFNGNLSSCKSKLNAIINSINNVFKKSEEAYKNMNLQLDELKRVNDLLQKEYKNEPKRNEYWYQDGEVYDDDARKYVPNMQFDSAKYNQDVDAWKARIKSLETTCEKLQQNIENYKGMLEQMNGSSVTGKNAPSADFYKVPDVQYYIENRNSEKTGVNNVGTVPDDEGINRPLYENKEAAINQIMGYGYTKEEAEQLVDDAIKNGSIKIGSSITGASNVGMTSDLNGDARPVYSSKEDAINQAMDHGYTKEEAEQLVDDAIKNGMIKISGSSETVSQEASGDTPDISADEGLTYKEDYYTTKNGDMYFKDQESFEKYYRENINPDATEEQIKYLATSPNSQFNVVGGNTDQSEFTSVMAVATEEDVYGNIGAQGLATSATSQTETVEPTGTNIGMVEDENGVNQPLYSNKEDAINQAIDHGYTKEEAEQLVDDAIANGTIKISESGSETIAQTASTSASQETHTSPNSGLEQNDLTYKEDYYTTNNGDMYFKDRESFEKYYRENINPDATEEQIKYLATSPNSQFNVVGGNTDQSEFTSGMEIATEKDIYDR